MSKNREHVIPKWLIKLTGDPNRTVYLGREWTTPELKERRFSFSAFTFPACESCNGHFATLEAAAQPIVGAILARESLRARDWSIFLDWLDKIRTGLWLGQIYLNRNYRGIEPVFHIQQRVGAKDRLAVIYAIQDDGRHGVGWSATDTPAFQSMPSCFAIAINSFQFVNTSCDFLFSRRMGFPYPSRSEIRTEGGFWLDMVPGTRAHMLPIIDRDLPSGGTLLLQPMIPWEHFRSVDNDVADQSALYDSDFVHAHCVDFAAGRGKLYLQQGDELLAFPESPSQDWLPTHEFPRGEVFHRTGVAVGHWLEDLYQDHPSFGSLPAERRQSYEERVEGVLALHKAMTDHFIAQRSMYY